MTQTMPHLVRYPTHVDFLVNGKPTLLFGGEIRNSSASTHAFLDTLWKPLRSLSLNFVLVPFSWRQFEPDEGTFDESLLSAIIQSAKKEGYSIAILWLATWKNGYSGYAPTWMWKNPDRFPLMSAQAFSPFGSETLQADQRAFTQLMKSIRALDPNGQTVVLVQVENEMGLLGDTRDRSPLAQQAFGSPVPSCLTHSLETHLAELKPAIRDAWTRCGCPHGLPWAQTFGTGDLCDEAFMAWHMATFTNAVAQAGKAIHPLPMFVNAWTIDPQNPTPGVHPCGGPVHTMLDIWMAAAPSIDLYAVDNYRLDYRGECLEYRHRGNPLFIPEAAGWWGGDHPQSAAAKAFYSFGAGALGFAPFGIDNQYYQEGLLAEAYKVLRQLEPLLLNARTHNRCRGFFRYKQQRSETIQLGDYELTIHYALESNAQQMFESGLDTQDPFAAFGLVIQESENSFVIAGCGFQMDFKLAETSDGSPLINLGVEEGFYDNGKWVVNRVMNGDEVPDQGTGGVKLPPSAYPVIGEPAIAIQRVSFLR